MIGVIDKVHVNIVMSNFKNGGKEWIVKKAKPFITNTNLNTKFW